MLPLMLYTEHHRVWPPKYTMHNKGATMTDVTYRSAVSDDVQQMMAIERASFADPWTYKDFKNHIEHKSISSIVATQNLGNVEEVIAFAFYQRMKKKFNLITIAVRTESRRAKHATELLTRIKRRLSRNRDLIISIVRESNLPVQMLFKKTGFLATNILKQPFEGVEEDGIMFEYKLDLSEPKAKNNEKEPEHGTQ